jgi:hypothetical protein
VPWIIKRMPHKKAGSTAELSGAHPSKISLLQNTWPQASALILYAA